MSSPDAKTSLMPASTERPTSFISIRYSNCYCWLHREVFKTWSRDVQTLVNDLVTLYMTCSKFDEKKLLQLVIVFGSDQDKARAFTQLCKLDHFEAGGKSSLQCVKNFKSLQAKRKKKMTEILARNRLTFSFIICNCSNFWES